jgi:hypothetical protein
VGANLLGPTIEYYLAAAPSGPVTIDILDSTGNTVNSYNSDAPVATAGGGRRGGGGFNPDAAMMVGRIEQNPGPAIARVTKNAGMNRFVWDVRHQNGLTVPPGPYTARLKAGSDTHSQSFNVLIDPRIAAEGVTVADLREQYEHNVRMRDMVQEVNRLAQRLQQAQARLKSATGAAADTAKAVEAVAWKVLTEPVRYGKPGLQEHIRYLAGMTANTDMKIGRDAIARHQVLRKELDAVKAEVDRALGPDRGTSAREPDSRLSLDTPRRNLRIRVPPLRR